MQKYNSLHLSIAITIISFFVLYYLKPEPLFIDDKQQNVPNTNIPLIFPVMLVIGLGSYRYYKK